MRFARCDSPVFVFGLSAGGMFAYQVACECENIAGIIATCLVDQRNDIVTRKTANSKFTAIMCKPLLKLLDKAFPNIKLPMKTVSNMQALA